MKKMTIFALLLVAACSKSPTDRMIAMCDKEEDKTSRESCTCTAKKLETKLSEEKYEQLVTEMEKSEEDKGDVNSVMNSSKLDQETLMTFMSAAKQCSTQ